MIRRIEVKNYKSLKYIDQSLDDFHVLIGPNASGKTTFMDVLNFMSDIVESGIDQAITNRSANFNDLTFSGKGGDIELGIEIALPESIKGKYAYTSFDTIRYEIRVGYDKKNNVYGIQEERVVIIDSESNQPAAHPQRTLFPSTFTPPSTILNKKYKAKTSRSVLRKKPGGNYNFYPETYKKSERSGYIPSFKLGIKRSALANLPADETKFPAASWLKDFLLSGVQLFILDSQNIKLASPPGKGNKFKTDGSNLPWVINELRKDQQQFKKWIAHIQTALPDIIDIDTVEREDDKHRYLRVFYKNDIRVPSWLVSDGTLRLLALTLPAYLPEFSGVYLIEEPENGIHPKAVETVYQSLSSVYNAQIMLATHSPVILSLVDKNHVLCFSKTPEGATDIVNGAHHPVLKDWKGETNLSVLYASGILG